MDKLLGLVIAVIKLAGAAKMPVKGIAGSLSVQLATRCKVPIKNPYKKTRQLK